MNLRQKRDIRRLARQIIQIIFFLWMPALYTSAFSGVRYVIEQIRAGKPIEQNAFLVMLIALCGLTILFGRFFCGYACAFGTLGDGMYALSQWVQKKVKKKLPWVSEETGRKLQKMKYIVLLVLMLIYALGFTKKFHGTSPWEVFSMLYTGKIPDASYLAGWVIFVLILVGMCLKERFFFHGTHIVCIIFFIYFFRMNQQRRCYCSRYTGTFHIRIQCSSDSMDTFLVMEFCSCCVINCTV